MKEKKSKILRELLKSNNFLPVPSCFDALSAKLIEQVGFKLMFMSGFAASASRIGQPDLGVMTLTEVLDQIIQSNATFNKCMYQKGYDYK